MTSIASWLNVYITEGKTDEAREILADRNIELEETTDQEAEEGQAAGGETAGSDSADASAPVELGAELNKLLSKAPYLVQTGESVDWEIFSLGYLKMDICMRI